MKKNLLIEDYEDKKTKDGKRYVRFKTSDGWMSCFDTKSNDALKAFENKTACVEVVESGDFKNIKKCYGAAEELEDIGAINEEMDKKVEVVRPGEVKKNGRNPYDKDPVGLAVEIFCALTDAIATSGTAQPAKEMMNQAIELVTQAKKAFE